MILARPGPAAAAAAAGGRASNTRLVSASISSSARRDAPDRRPIAAASWSADPMTRASASPAPAAATAPRRRTPAPPPRASAAAGGGDAAPSPPPLALGPVERRVAAACRAATMAFPVWVLAAAWLGVAHPPAFTWVTDGGVTLALAACMLGMGLTLTFAEIAAVFTRRPHLLLLGMALQYTVLPVVGWAISRHWGLARPLAVGVALVSCMPGGTASNIIALIAKGDMPLSLMMTTASTVFSVVTTPLLTKLLLGALVPVDATAMLLSTVQLVLAPVLLGAAVNQWAPGFVSRARLYTPCLATALVALIVGSMTATNSAVVAASGWDIAAAVLTLHGAGFALGYGVSKALGLSDKVARTNCIEVGMQSSALAAVLARTHFPNEPMIVAPCVISACAHALVGSFLAGWWNLTVKDEDA